MASAIPMIRRCAEHQDSQGYGVSWRETTSTEPCPQTSTSEIPPSDRGIDGAQETVTVGEIPYG